MTPSPEQLRGLCLAFTRDDACLIRSDNTRSANAWEGSLFPCFVFSKQEAYAHAFATNHTAAENPTHGPRSQECELSWRCTCCHAGPDFHILVLPKSSQVSALPLLVPSWYILEFRPVHHIRACWPALAYDSGQESFLIGLPRVRSENRDQMVPNKVLKIIRESLGIAMAIATDILIATRQIWTLVTLEKRNTG
jgi:hypothetical protein